MIQMQKSAFGIPDGPLDTNDPNLRKTALFLHAMARADRDWLIGQLSGQLSPIQRAQLTALLDELQVLGIPRDQSLLEEAIAAPLSPVTGEPEDVPYRKTLLEASPATNEERCDMIDNADPVQLSAILSKEPATLIAHVLQLRPWRWRETVLGLLTIQKRLQVQAHCAALSAKACEETASPASLEHALALSLAQRLCQSQAAHLPASLHGRAADRPGPYSRKQPPSRSWLFRTLRFVRDGRRG